MHKPEAHTCSIRGREVPDLQMTVLRLQLSPLWSAGATWSVGLSLAPATSDGDWGNRPRRDVDKLDGDVFYKFAGEWRPEQQCLQREIDCHETAEQSCTKG
jgi:hypothetical protein